MKPTGYISEVFGSFQGEGPFVGERHIFVRFAGCSLGCKYCDTRYSLKEAEFASIEDGAGKTATPFKNPMPVRAIVEAVLAQEIFPGFNSKLAITGGEPLEQPEFLRALLEEMNGRFKTLLETNGILPDALARVRDLTDIISMDIKLPSVTGKGELWDAHRDFLDAAKGKELIVKAVVSRDTPVEEMERAAKMLAEVSPDAIFVIQPVALPLVRGRVAPQETGWGRLVPPSLLMEEGWGDGDCLFAFYLCAKRMLKNVRVIPQVHKIMGVR
ncbi:MAG: 7-carboxy-7-deazaguanine synthase QueE [Nitrospirota bacterium]